MLAEGIPGGFSAIYSELSQLETLGVARRGYFLEGLGGAQFALPGAVERLRARSGVGAAGSDDANRPRSCCRPSIRPSPTARRCRGPRPTRNEGTAARRRPARTAGAHVVLVGGDPVLYLERGGKGLQTLVAGRRRPPGARPDRAGR